MRKAKVEPEKIREMKKPRRGWSCIPACVREELGIRRRAFCSDRVSSHGFVGAQEIGYFGGLAGFGKALAVSRTVPPVACGIRGPCCTASNLDLLILIVSAYCSGSRCSRFNLI